MAEQKRNAGAAHISDKLLLISDLHAERPANVAAINAAHHGKECAYTKSIPWSPIILRLH